MLIDTFGYDTKMPVYLPQPVNARHPLNRGRTALWLTLPGLYGGRQWLDLIGLNNGVLTNMSSTSGWRGTTRPGGCGHLQFDGTDDLVLLPDGAYFSSGTGDFTIAAWGRVTTPGTTQFLVNNYGTSGNAQIGLFASTASKFTSNFRDDGGVQELRSIGATTVITNTWYRVVGVKKGTTGFLYVNGVQDATVSNGSIGTITTSVSDVPTIGSNRTGGVNGNFFGGAIDDVALWNRALSAAEVKSDYDLSRLGYPGVLNRVQLQSPGYAQYTPPFFSMVSNPIPIAQR